MIDRAALRRSYRLDGGLRELVRPVHIRTRATLWQSRERRLAAETQHELGSNAFHHFSLVFEQSWDDRPGDRLQVFLSVAPGRQLHVSPLVGGLRVEGAGGDEHDEGKDSGAERRCGHRGVPESVRKYASRPSATPRA